MNTINRELAPREWSHEERIAAANNLPPLKSMTREQFIEWLDENPTIYKLFRRFAVEALVKGRKRFSVYMIRERVRWYTNVEYSGEFKISNNVTPYIARLLAAEVPRLAHIFSIKATP